MYKIIEELQHISTGNTTQFTPSMRRFYPRSAHRKETKSHSKAGSYCYCNQDSSNAQSPACGSGNSHPWVGLLLPLPEHSNSPTTKAPEAPERKKVHVVLYIDFVGGCCISFLRDWCKPPGCLEGRQLPLRAGSIFCSL